MQLAGGPTFPTALQSDALVASSGQERISGARETEASEKKDHRVDAADRPRETSGPGERGAAASARGCFQLKTKCVHASWQRRVACTDGPRTLFSRLKPLSRELVTRELASPESERQPIEGVIEARSSERGGSGFVASTDFRLDCLASTLTVSNPREGDDRVARGYPKRL